MQKYIKENVSRLHVLLSRLSEEKPRVSLIRLFPHLDLSNNLLWHLQSMRWFPCEPSEWALWQFSGDKAGRRAVDQDLLPAYNGCVRLTLSVMYSKFSSLLRNLENDRPGHKRTDSQTDRQMERREKSVSVCCHPVTLVRFRWGFTFFDDACWTQIMFSTPVRV